MGKRGTIFRSVSLLPFLAAAIVSGQSAQAQDTASNPSGAGDVPDYTGDIVVTAQRRSESVQRVPVSVSVATGESLLQSNITKLEDLSARQPNLKIATAPASDQLRIRGAGSGFNPGFEQSVATFLDGQYFGRSRSSRVALFDVERIEVLKGPQTTFFGANAIAGALNISTRKPGNEFEVNATALYTPTTNEYVLETGVSVPVTDTLSTRVAVRASGMDGYVNIPRLNETGPHLDDWQGRVAIRWAPSSTFEIDAKADVASLRDNNVFATQLVGCPPARSTANGRCAAVLAANNNSIDDKLNYRSDVADGGISNIDVTLLTLTPKLHLGAIDLIAITGYYEQKATVRSDIAPFPGLSPTGTTTNAPSYTFEDVRDFSQEIRLQSADNTAFTWMIGGYYEHQDLEITSMLGRYFTNLAARSGGQVASGTPVAYLGIFKQTTETYSIFASGGYEITPNLSINGGLRYSSVSKDASSVGSYGAGTSILSPERYTVFSAAAQLALQPAAGFPLGNYADPQRTDDAVMFSGTVQYDITQMAMAYAKFTRGFKAGGYAASSLATFDPEYVDAYEIGLKASFLDRRLTTSLALYNSIYRNLQDSQNISTNTTTLFVITNVGKSLARGVEASANFKVTPHLNIGADVAYLDSHYISYRNAACDPVLSATVPNCQQDLSGRRLPFSPQWSGSGYFNLDMPISDRTNLQLGGTAYFSSDFFLQSAITDLVKQAANVKFDGRIGISFADGMITASVIGKNLTDRRTASYINYTPGAVGTATALIDPPRTVSFQLSFKY